MTSLIEASMSALAERYTPPVVRVIRPIVVNDNDWSYAPSTVIQPDD